MIWEELKGGIYISPKDIQVLSDCTIDKARKEHALVRDVLEIEPKKLTVKAYCDYFKLDYELVITYLNQYR